MTLLSTWLRKTPDSLKEALTASRLGALEQNIKDALCFLRKNYLKAIFLRQKLPWYIVFGAENSGKTSLLAMSGLHLVSTDSLALQHIASTTYCQWFFSKEAVFVDTSGNLMLPEHIDTSTLHLWKKFIALLSRYRRSHPMNGIILCIDLLNFQDKSFDQQRQYVDILRHHIQAFPPLIPVYLIFTRCDRIQGFTEFFHTLTNKEREQVCGISVPLVDQQNFAQSLEEHFNIFLLHLNQQIFSCLQRERNLEKRVRIRNFPLQLEAHKKAIVQLNSQLHSTKNPIKGVYFTSSQQEGVQSDALLPLLDTFGLPAEANTSDRPLQKNAFFIKNTLKKIIQSGESLLPPQKTVGQKILHGYRFYTLLSGMFLTLLLLMLSSYFYNQKAINDVQAILTNYQTQQTTSTEVDALSLLNTLRKGQDELTHATNFLTALAFHQASHLKSQLNTLYNQALEKAYTPKLERVLETQLQADIETKSSAVFNTLKVYLMMGNLSHRDINFMYGWFKDHLQNTFAENQENKHFFKIHLQAWFEKNQSARFKTDSTLIASARETLNALSPNDLVYANLTEKYQTSPTKSPLENPLYLAKNFQTIYQQDIPSISEQTNKNDAWVLEEILPENLTHALLPQLTSNVQELYVTRYIDFWAEQLAHLVPSFKDLNAARLFATSLNTDHSSLFESLDIIQTNLAPVAGIPEGQRTIALVEKTRGFLSNTHLNEETKQAIQGMTNYLDDMLTSTNMENTVLIATQKRMQNHDKDAITQLISVANTAPAPVNYWLKQLAENTWQIMLQTSKEYVSTRWETDVFPKYKAQILNRYPVFKDARSQEISLSDFTKFFGPNGTMDSFFKQNLSAFVDSSTLYWQWKKLDGSNLDIPQSTLEIFNRASIIRRMYFADNSNLLSVKFTLTPTNIDLISSNLLLNLEGQPLNYGTDFRQPKHISWPGKKFAPTSLTLEKVGKKETFYTENGDWAVFKLLANASLSTSQNPRLYELEFNLKGQKVNYELLAETPINPFIPDILTAFRCSDRLS